jgi:hypothetical protein
MVKLNQKAILHYLRGSGNNKKDFDKIKLGTYKGELKLLHFKPSSSTAYSSFDLDLNVDGNFFQEIDNSNWDGYYPFYGLTPEQLKDKDKLKEKWGKFIKSVKRVAHPYENAAE